MTNIPTKEGIKMLSANHKLVSMKKIEKPFTWQITLESLDESKKIVDIKISSPNLLTEFLHLKNNETSRIYLAYHMTDVDVYKRGAIVGIMNSPHELAYNDYFITNEDFELIVEQLS